MRKCIFTIFEPWNTKIIKQDDFTVDTIKQILGDLSKKRPIFHSEADFQHALAWEIHQKLNKIDIRLEKRFMVNTLDEIYVDIYLKLKNVSIVIETKYTTKKLEIELNGEEFVLKDHRGLTERRKDFLYDIYRLEKLKNEKKITKGYAIFLTNNPSYWTQPQKDTNDKSFRIHEGQKIQKGQSYTYSKSTGKNKVNITLKLEKEYSFKWTPYSSSKDNNYEFKYLLVEV